MTLKRGKLEEKNAYSLLRAGPPHGVFVGPVPGVDGVGVAVDETRQDQPAPEVEHGARRAFTAHRHDPAVAHR